MIKKARYKYVVRAFLLLVSIATFIPAPPSTEESYNPSLAWVIIQILIFSLSRLIFLDKKFLWLVVLEIVGFILIVYMFNMALMLF